jgi:serine/threonine protein kinase/Flp pilus assembly protein TadD
MNDPSPLEAIFFAALEKGSPQERAAYLDEASAGNPDLRRRVEKMLAAQAQASSFLDHPAPGPVVTIDEPITERPGTVIDPYKLREQIGEGGFGVVFLAEQQQPIRRKVALKVLKPGMDTRQVIARFEAERQALALMDHPHIAKVLDAGQTSSGRPYFVMDLVKGVPITEYCDQSRFTLQERLGLFVHVCQAVQHAHQKGIIHRDLKPSNVLVTVQDGAPLVKVIDFGIAKALGQQLTDKTLFTGFAQLIGTPLYMSPEQAALSNVDVDTRSDIFSLGVVLYELLTGATPFDKERFKEAGFDEIRRIIREEEPAKPSTRITTLGQAATTVATHRKSDPKRLCHLLRGELDWIVLKCLEKDRNRRYETASALAADVQRYLNDEPVLACPPSAWYRFRKFARRKKTALAMAAGIFLALAGMAGVMGWAVRDRAARRDKVAGEVRAALKEANALHRQALDLIDHPSQWQVSLAAAQSALQRAQALADSVEDLGTAVLDEITEVKKQLQADERDRRFVARFEELRMEGTEVDVVQNQFKLFEPFIKLKDALAWYGIEPVVSPPGAAGALIRRRPPAVRLRLWVALLYLSLHPSQANPQAQKWHRAVRKYATELGPWWRQVSGALKAARWSKLNGLVEKVKVEDHPPALLVLLAQSLPSSKVPAKLEFLGRVQSAYPGDFWANVQYAVALVETKPARWEEAIRYYNAALALRPDNPGVYFNLGIAHWNKGEVSRAGAALRKAISLKPQYKKARDVLIQASWKQFNLGLALAKQGKLGEAIAAFRTGIEFNPNDGQARNDLAWWLGTCADLKLRNPDQAVAHAKKAVKLDRHNGDYWHTLGVAYCRTGAWKAATRALEKAMKFRKGGDSFDWFFLAMAHWQLGEKAKARRWYHRAVQWMDKNRPRDEELGRFRSEAAALLGIEAKSG